MIGKWRCSDIGTALYEGYASPIERVELERICGPLETTGSLPFTGFDLGLVLVIGLAIIVAGLILRRSSR